MFACNSGTLVRHAGASKAGSGTSADDEVDPRLKNFEPRMVELIISEVTEWPLTNHFTYAQHWRDDGIASGGCGGN